MDTVLHFLFWAVIETVLFRLGRVALRVISIGRVRLEKPTPFQVFIVAGFGFLVVLGVVLVIASVAVAHVPISA
ncbi:MAG: hypothetical protein KGL40_00325 [Rhodocyclaceae bacterium]|nr:hypothetical protein [Rhodocyclaceae bacterium]